MRRLVYAVSVPLLLASCTATQPCPPVSQAAELRPAERERIVPPSPTKRVPPRYPETLREARVEGSAEVRAVIGCDGRPHGIEVLSATRPEFGRAVADALAQWRFSPATLDGEPVSVHYELAQSFTVE